MKKTTLLTSMLSVCLIAALPFIAFISACDSKKNVPPIEDEQTYAENLIKSNSKYKQAMNARTSASEKKFSIKEVSRNGSTLTISVEGGCSNHSFKVIWDGTIVESYPMQVHMVLVEEENTSNCQNSKHFSIQVDLYALLGDYARLEDYHFFVHNGSAIQDVSLPGDKAVSNQ